MCVCVSVCVSVCELKLEIPKLVLPKKRDFVNGNSKILVEWIWEILDGIKNQTAKLHTKVVQ